MLRAFTELLLFYIISIITLKKKLKEEYLCCNQSPAVDRQSGEGGGGVGAHRSRSISQSGNRSGRTELNRISVFLLIEITVKQLLRDKR